MNSVVVRSSIEIAQQNRPYNHAKWPPYERGFNLSRGFHRFKDLIYKEIYKATLQLNIKRNITTAWYLLEALEDSRLFQAKAWIMFSFATPCVLETVKSSQLIDCERDTPAEEIEGLAYGEYWERVAIFTRAELPLKFVFPQFQFEILNHAPFSHIILWRKKDLSRMELAFIWARKMLPKGKYVTSVRLEECS